MLEIETARVSCRICSNPDCRAFTIRPAAEDPSVDVDTGVVVPLPDGSGVFLCRDCAEAVAVDPNRHSDDVLQAWRAGHLAWVSANLNLRTARRRTVSADQARELAEKLAGFPCESVDFVTAGDGESIALKESLKATLSAGGWSIVEEHAALAGLEVPGVVIHIKRGDELRPSVAELIRWTRATGLLNYCKRWDHVERIRIDVGANPASS